MSRGRPSKRQHIIEVARQLFAEHGYQGTSIDQVVIAAGVSKPTVYNNFPTKLSLLHAFLEGLTGELEAVYQAVLNEQEFGVAGVSALYAKIIDLPEHLLVFRLNLGESYKLDADAKELLNAYITDLQTYREALLRAGGVDVDAAQQALVAALFSAYVLEVALVGDEPDHEGVMMLAHRVLQS